MAVLLPWDKSYRDEFVTGAIKVIKGFFRLWIYGCKNIREMAMVHLLVFDFKTREHMTTWPVGHGPFNSSTPSDAYMGQ